MYVNIPIIGDVLTLEEAWSFDLMRNEANRKFLFTNVRHPDIEKMWENEDQRFTFTLAEGVRLKIDGVFMRGKGVAARKRDMIAVWVNPGNRLKPRVVKGRLMVSVHDLNRIVYAPSELAQVT